VPNLLLEKELAKDEYGAILRWLIDGYAEWKKTGLKPPKVMRERSKAYIAESDDVQAFADEELVQDGEEKNELTSRNLFNHWKAWAEERKAPTGEINDFVQT